jgi:hypothetical protein
MKKLICNIIYRTLGILLVVLTVVSAMAQKSVTKFEVNQCDTIEFSVVDWPGDRYTWDIYRDSTVNFAKAKGDVEPAAYFVDGMYGGSAVRVVNLESGRYFLRVMVWDEVVCTNNLLIFMLDVLESQPVATLEGDSVCIGETATVKVILTGMGPWDIKYTYGDGTDIVNLNGITENEFNIPIPLVRPGKTDFWVMEVVEDNGVCRIVNSTPTQKVGVLIYAKPKNSKIYLKK